MSESTEGMQASHDQILAGYIAADRQRQLDEAHYANAITDPETSERYHTDLGFRLQIDLHRQSLHAVDRALDDEGISPEQRNRIMHGLITSREPYRGVPIVFGQAMAMDLPHGPFSIAAGEWAGAPYAMELVVHCVCGQARKWQRGMAGGELLVWLRDHPAEKERRKAAPRLRDVVRHDGNAAEPIPEREQLVHDNPELAQQIRDGIEEAETGRTVSLGSFAQYLNDEDEESGA